MLIESIDEWNNFAKTLFEFDCHLWELQYGVDQPEGFHAKIVSSNGSVFRVETHSMAVYRAIMRFHSQTEGKML